MIGGFHDARRPPNVERLRCPERPGEPTRKLLPYAGTVSFPLSVEVERCPP